MIEIKGDNLKYDHRAENYVPNNLDLGLAIWMRGSYTEDELRKQLAKLVEANSFAGQGRLSWATVTKGGFAALRDYFVVRTVNGQVVSKTPVASQHAARMLIEKVTGRYGDWAVIPADRSIEELMKPYTPKQRAAMAEAFKAAQKYQPREHYLCFSLTKAGEVNPSIRTACAMAQKEVRRRIRPHTVVNSWLKKNGHCVETSYEDMMIYRRRWLASLVAEFSTP